MIVNRVAEIRAKNCDTLVASATKHWALATKISELVAS